MGSAKYIVQSVDFPIKEKSLKNNNNYKPMFLSNSMAPEMYLDVFILDDNAIPKYTQKKETSREFQEELVSFF